jgi:peptide/nickel transport system substrate-binding protein
MEFERNPDYFGAEPGIDRVILKFVGDAGITELLAGNVDMARADLTQIPATAADPRFQLYVQGSAGARGIYWKNDHPLFSDARVRHALTRAIDRPELLPLLNLPEELPITDGVFTGRQFRRGDSPEPFPYDQDEARRLLDEVGWVDLDGDGVREKDGRPFHFTAIVGQDAAMPQLALYVQDALRQIGVRMDVRAGEPAQMWEILASGDFEALFMVVQSGVFPQLRDFGRSNPTGYYNPEAFDVIDSLQTEASPEEQDRLYLRLTDLYRTDMPFTRLIPWSNEWFVHRRILGLSTPYRATPDTYMEELWVEDLQ